MIRVVTAAEMKELDRRTIEEMEMPSAVLMERAALAVKEEILRRFPRGGRVLCACGGGNNGGDALVCARRLHEHYRREVVVFSVRDRESFSGCAISGFRWRKGFLPGHRRQGSSA